MTTSPGDDLISLRSLAARAWTTIKRIRVTPRGTSMIPTAAEAKLLREAAAGKVADYTDDEDKVIRAGFLYILCSQQDEEWKVHPKGIRVCGADVVGELDLDSSSVATPLTLRDCRFDKVIVLRNARTKSICLSRSRVPGIAAEALLADGDLVLDDGFVAKGPVQLARAQIKGQLSCRRGRFWNPGGEALNADAAIIAGDTQLDQGFIARGAVRLQGAQIAGQLTCRGSRLRNATGQAALNAERLVAKGGVFLNAGFVAEGGVRLLGAEIEKQFSCRRGTFRNPGKETLNADRIDVKGSVLLNDRFTADGEVRLFSATISGQLNCGAAIFSNQGGVALNAEHVVTKGHVLLNKRFSADGEVRFKGAEIGGQLSCKQGTFRSDKTPALNVSRALVADDVLLNDGFTAVGEVRFKGAEIGGQLECVKAAFRNPDAVAFDGEDMKVTGALVWRELLEPPKGDVNFSHASVGHLRDDSRSWPSDGKGGLTLTGFVYRALPDDDSMTVALRKDWLSRQAGYSPQPYEQLARVYRDTGHEKDAREVAIAKEDTRRAKGDLSQPSKVWNWVMSTTVSYGYKPWKVLRIMLVLLLVGSVLFTAAPASKVMMPTKIGTSATDADRAEAAKCRFSYPCFQPVIYQLELLIPIINLHQREYWLPDARRHLGWVYLGYVWFSIIVGWVLTTTVVAGLTGVFKK